MESALSLKAAFEGWGLPLDARVFLLKVWDAIQFLDDVKDGHVPQAVDNAIYTLIVGLPFDEFLSSNRNILMGAMVTAYHKWQAANHAEERGEELDKAYMWRAGYYDLVLLVIALCKPREDVEMIAPEVLALYGETRESYLKEFGSA